MEHSEQLLDTYDEAPQEWAAKEITSTVLNETIDLDVSRCLRCVVERHPTDYVNTAVASVAVGQCLGMSYQRVSASLKRMSYADQPPVVRERRALPFRLTAYADQLHAPDTPENCQKISPGSVHKKPQPSEPLQPRLTQQEKLIQECVKDIASPEEQAQAAKRIQTLIDKKIIALRRVRVTEVPIAQGYPDRGSWVHFAIGKALRNEAAGVQKALLYHVGVDHLVYGSRLDPVQLRQELCLLPLDELSAVAELTLYKLDRANDKS